METKFKLTRDEYAEFIKLAYGRMAKIGNGGKKFFLINLLAWIVIGMGFAGIFRFYEVNEGINFQHLNYALMFWGISIVGLILATTYQRKFYMHYSLSDNGHMLKEQSVSATEESITFSTINTKQSYEWTAIQEIEISKSFICMYIDNNQALLVPCRSFKDKESKEEFVNFVEDQIALTKPSSGRAKGARR
ncbi:MAG: hypothetical protein B6D75_07475 [gamma proteobacterium symbiont of Stewartia floridana]|nr:MAG: hypothetical protein B6D75_07475 [gamma proteobacterium symbiont of Stewartia floridana]